MSGRRRGVAGLLVILALGAILVLSRPRQDGWTRPSLDPRATNPRGLAALVDLLREEGATVRLGGRPDVTDDVVLQVRDTFSGAPARQLERWVRAGGTLVVTDPSAASAPETGGSLLATRSPGVCDVRALADVDRLGIEVRPPYEVGPGDGSCFGDGREAWLVTRREGAGVVVALGDPSTMINGGLARGDDAVLAMALLAPTGTEQVRILDPLRFVGDEEEVGDGTILGALPARGRQALLLLVVAFLCWGLARGRRLGRPVPEELPVPLPASDLVLSTGELLARRRDVADAADRLRRHARRSLGRRLGLGPDPDPAVLADALRSRSGADVALVDRALFAPVLDEDELIALAADLDRLQEDLHATPAAR